MNESKFRVGDTFCVWWEIAEVIPMKRRHFNYRLKNKANGMEVVVSRTTLDRIARGELEVSKILYHKINGNGTKGVISKYINETKPERERRTKRAIAKLKGDKR